MFLISGPSLLYVFKKWSEFTLKVVRVYLKSGPSLPGPNLPGPSLLVFIKSNNIITNRIKQLPIAQDTHSIVIENIRSLKSTNNIIIGIFNKMNLNTNSITKVKYNYNNIELFVNSKFAKSQFLSERQLLSNSDYASLFIRSSLDNDTLRHGRILYHALKSDYSQDEYIYSS